MAQLSPRPVHRSPGALLEVHEVVLNLKVANPLGYTEITIVGARGTGRESSGCCGSCPAGISTAACEVRAGGAHCSANPPLLSARESRLRQWPDDVLRS